MHAACKGQHNRSEVGNRSNWICDERTGGPGGIVNGINGSVRIQGGNICGVSGYK